MFSIDVVASSQTTHVFADSKIALLCHTLRICVAHAPTESCPFCLLRLVHWAFQACYRSHLPLMPTLHTVKVITVHWGSVGCLQPTPSFEWFLKAPQHILPFTQWNAIGPHHHLEVCPQARNVNHCKYSDSLLLQDRLHIRIRSKKSCLRRS